ncbi:MAG: TlpA family protein disulfide reductase [Acidobacteria bacterium]|nr:TlpA family protein disulfide reductase [Acidobacteriota bacterium]
MLTTPSEPHPLLGTPAPLFKLPLLDEGEFDLSQQKDKNIVILDFWATWCGPCKSAMPIIIEVAEEYKDRGVVLITVNLGKVPKKFIPFCLSRA